MKTNIPASITFTVISLAALCCGLSTADAEPVTTPPSVQSIVIAESDKTPLEEIFIEVCAEKGFYEPFCWKDLKAIGKVESQLDIHTKPGDNGCSIGIFQINVCVHKNVTMTQAEDPWFAARWTLNYLVNNGYPEYRRYAIQCHNGCNASNGYVDKVCGFAKSF